MKFAVCVRRNFQTHKIEEELNMTSIGKRVVAGLLAVSLTTLLAGCGSDGDDKQVIRISTAISGETSPTIQALKLLQQNIEEKSNGEMEVQLFPAGQLGNETDGIDQCRIGDVHMTTSNPMNINPAIPTLATFDQYFMFDDMDHALRFCNGEGGQYILDAYNKQGLQGVAFFPLGFRNLTNNRGPIEELSDLKGLKIRGYNPIQIAAWEAVGCNLSSVTWNELFTAMQQKLIDGQEGALTSFSESKFYEVQKCVTLTQHVFSTDILVANQEWLEGLDPEDREFILGEVEIAEQFQQEEMIRQTNELMKQLEEEHGTQFNELPPETFQEMREIMGGITEESIVGICGQEAFDTVMAYADEAR